MTHPKPSPGAGKQLWPGIFAGMIGALLGLSLLKFGNPLVLDHLVQKPSNLDEFIYQPWPLVWGYGLLGVVLIAGLPLCRWTSNGLAWQSWALVIWFGWQLIASNQTVDARLSWAALSHFAACVVCF